MAGGKKLWSTKPHQAPVKACRSTPKQAQTKCRARPEGYTESSNKQLEAKQNKHRKCSRTWMIQLTGKRLISWSEKWWKSTQPQLSQNSWNQKQTPSMHNKFILYNDFCSSIWFETHWVALQSNTPQSWVRKWPTSLRPNADLPGCRSLKDSWVFGYGFLLVPLRKKNYNIHQKKGMSNSNSLPHLGSVYDSLWQQGLAFGVSHPYHLQILTIYLQLSI